MVIKLFFNSVLTQASASKKVKQDDSNGWIVKDFNIESANVESFKRLDFPQILSSCWYYYVVRQEWENRIFSLYFPDKAKDTAAQHFSQAKYYQKWLTLMLKATVEDALKLKETAFEWFKTLKWLP